jgi:DNA-binding NarL/FixJ family response regulator
MIATEKKVAIIGSNLYETKAIKTALTAIYNIEQIVVKDCLLQYIQSLEIFKKPPAVIFIEMKITAGDALVATTILKATLPKTKIVVYAPCANINQIQSFISEGANAFIATETLEACNSNNSKKAENALYNLQQLLQNITNSDSPVIDTCFKASNQPQFLINTTQKIVQNIFSHYTKQQVLLLQLNVLGVKQQKMNIIVHLAPATISRYFKKLQQDFRVSTPKELALATICNGIAKIVMLYDEEDTVI